MEAIRTISNVGVIPLLTGLLRVCPAYPLLGISTCPLKEGRKT